MALELLLCVGVGRGTEEGWALYYFPGSVDSYAFTEHFPATISSWETGRARIRQYEYQLMLSPP